MTGRRISRRRLLSGALGLAVVSGCGYVDASPAQPPPPALSADFPVETLFVTPAWLKERLGDPKLRLFDLSPLPDYRQGHIPKARHVWWQETIEVQNPVYGMLVNNSGRATIVEEAGITPDSIVVCYDRSGGVYASRLIWMLQFMGFPSARLLNGGIQGWQSSGYDLTLDEPAPSPGGIDDIYNEFINAHGEDILARLDEPGLVILDTRTEGERAETWNDRLREGKIPGSVWLPRGEFLVGGPVPALITAEALNRKLRDRGIVLEATAEMIVYGLHGTLGALPYLALQALDDFHLRLYDGAWAQWGENDAWPVEPIFT